MFPSSASSWLLKNMSSKSSSPVVITIVLIKDRKGDENGDLIPYGQLKVDILHTTEHLAITFNSPVDKISYKMLYQRKSQTVLKVESLSGKCAKYSQTSQHTLQCEGIALKTTPDLTKPAVK